MKEMKRTYSIPVGRSELITAFSGTKQILSTVPNPVADVIIDITITEITKNN